MGLLDKVKKILFDEDEIEVPVKNEELPDINKKEEKVERKGFIDYHSEDEEDTIKEVVVPKEKPTKTFNFVEDDFDPADYKQEEELPSFDFKRTEKYNFDEEIPQRRETVVEPVRENRRFDYNEITKEVPLRRDYKLEINTPKKEEVKDYKKILKEETKEKEKKPFIVTPIISPVYGILDKNYKPEEIVEKKPIKEVIEDKPRDFGPVSYNNRPLPKVEEKIEEEKIEEIPVVEMEDTITDIIAPSFEEYKEEVDETDEIIQTENYDELTTSGIEEKYIGDNSIEDAFEPTSEFDAINEADKEIDSTDESDAGLDNTIETDLFNLIDSMYKSDDKEEE